jgi:DNA (cytosine-5)-methyltransferase 1
MDKYARQTYIYNYGEPAYYPENVYDRVIPEESLDIYMTSPPCQGFSIAGKRGGSILFLNSHEFIVKNKPRYFIFENVKGLLSHEKKNKDDTYGNTFNQWLNYLGGKSVNGNPVIFPHEESVPYHIYHKVINAKKCGVPQNRDRVFIVGIRDDSDNTFTWHKDLPLEKRLKDVLEDEVDDKYYLSENAINSLINNHDALQKSKVNPEIASCLQSPGNACGNYKGMTAISEPWIADYRTDEGLRIRKSGLSPCMTASMKKNTETMKRGNCVPLVGLKDKIRRLTPTECFRLMDFNPSFKWNVSDTQAYKQAGNSIVVACLVRIISKLNLY